MINVFWYKRVTIQMDTEKKARLEVGWYIRGGSDYEYVEVKEDGTLFAYDFEDDILGRQIPECPPDIRRVSQPLITKGIVVWDFVHKYHPAPFFSALEDERWSQVTLVALENKAVIHVDGYTYLDNRWLEYAVLKMAMELEPRSFMPYYEIPSAALGILQDTYKIKEHKVLVRFPADKEFMLIYNTRFEFLFGSEDPNFIALVLNTILS